MLLSFRMPSLVLLSLMMRCMRTKLRSFASAGPPGWVLCMPGSLVCHPERKRGRIVLLILIWRGVLVVEYVSSFALMFIGRRAPRTCCVRCLRRLVAPWLFPFVITVRAFFVLRPVWRTLLSMTVTVLMLRSRSVLGVGRVLLCVFLELLTLTVCSLLAL